MQELIKNPYVIGALPPLFLCCYILFSSFFKIRQVHKDKRDLEKHLLIKLNIEAEALELQKKKMDEIQKENENLRITVQTMRSKPTQDELELLYVYDMALQAMFERAPGFAGAWQTARKEAELEMAKTHSGLLPRLKRALGFSPTYTLKSGISEAGESQSKSENGDNEKTGKPT